MAITEGLFAGLMHSLSLNPEGETIIHEWNYIWLQFNKFFFWNFSNISGHKQCWNIAAHLLPLSNIIRMLLGSLSNTS